MLSRPSPRALCSQQRQLTQRPVLDLRYTPGVTRNAPGPEQEPVPFIIGAARSGAAWEVAGTLGIAQKIKFNLAAISARASVAGGGRAHAGARAVISKHEHPEPQTDNQEFKMIRRQTFGVAFAAASIILFALPAQAKTCKSTSITGVGHYKLTWSVARASAIRSWRTWARARHGYRWNTWSRAKNRSLSCSRSGRRKRCVATGTPCRL